MLSMGAPEPPHLQIPAIDSVCFSACSAATFAALVHCRRTVLTRSVPVIISFLFVAWVAKDLAFCQFGLAPILPPTPHGMVNFLRWVDVVDF